MIMCLPLLHIDCRLPTSAIVSCSDASERGGGVVVATGLACSGYEALLRRLSAVPNLLRHKVVLVDSCAGIGGARRGFDLLGIVPALYLVSETAVDALRVLQRQWPEDPDGSPRQRWKWRFRHLRPYFEPTRSGARANLRQEPSTDAWPASSEPLFRHHQG